MPWLGFFKKVLNSDIFCVLDHVVNNPRDSAFWCRRVRILLDGKEHWLSIPIQKEKGVLVKPINTMVLGDNKKALKQIYSAYAKLDYYDDYKYLVEDYFNSDVSSLVKRNMNFIEDVLNLLEYDGKLVYSSCIVDSKLASNNMLVKIVKELGGDTYLAGDGAKGYQDNKIFSSNNVQVIYNNFNGLEYKQAGDKNFVGGLSVIDALFNIGVTRTKELIYQS
ncbi:WbqC family protein [Akkermansiaceae bacterium]|nr:WbqC family protein [Akkermansiaceae bacterium]